MWSCRFKSIASFQRSAVHRRVLKAKQQQSQWLTRRKEIGKLPKFIGLICAGPILRLNNEYSEVKQNDTILDLFRHLIEVPLQVRDHFISSR